MKIIKVDLLDASSVSILLAQEWQHEQITELSQLILAKLTDSRVIEQVLGGDREYVRFEWQNQVWHLQFEWYGQSIWFELESGQQSPLVKHLYQKLLK